MDTAMITATAWVPRGFAAQFPVRKELNDEEFERIAAMSKLKLEDAQDDLEDAEAEARIDEKDDADAGPSDDEDDEKMEEDADEVEAAKAASAAAAPSTESKKEKDDDDLAEYNLDAYDDEGVDETGEQMGMFANIKSLAYHQPGEEDPYITLKDDEDEEEKEELQILATDNLLLTCKTEDEVAHLEVYVYEDSEDNLYVHHDIILPAIPLCVEWLDIPPPGSSDVSKHGNFCAIGTMDPEIEIWNLDLVDTMYPDAVLGAAPTDANGKKKKKKKKAKANDTYHVDAVLSLSSNRSHRNLLASGSADQTIKLWDLTTTQCAKSYNYHTDRVCAVTWHPTEPTILLSGSYDRTVVAADMRAPDAKAPRWGVESDVETVRWDPHDPNYFYATTENGIVHLHDVRNAPSNPAKSKPVWLLQAHDGPVSAFDVNPIIPGFLATGGFDKAVKLWNVQPNGAGPSMIVSREMGVGKVFSTQFGPDAEVGFRLSVAGSKGVVHVWDTSTNKFVRQVFQDRVPEPKTEVEDRLVGIDDSSSEGEDDEDSDNADDSGNESTDEEDMRMEQ